MGVPRRRAVQACLARTRLPTANLSLPLHPICWPFSRHMLAVVSCVQGGGIPGSVIVVPLTYQLPVLLRTRCWQRLEAIVLPAQRQSESRTVWRCRPCMPRFLPTTLQHKRLKCKIRTLSSWVSTSERRRRC